MKIGNINISNLKLGTIQIKKVFIGLDLVWTSFLSIINDFKTRVLSNQGEFEGETCLNNTLEDMGIDLFDQASLVFTPNGYKENVLYSIKPNDTASNFTTTRATTGTRVNSDGLIEEVPYNLFSWSEDFSNILWTKNNLTITTNQTIAPDGNITADLCIPNTTTGEHQFAQTLTSTGAAILVTPNNTYNLSIYVKPAGNNFFLLRVSMNGVWSQNTYNLSTGTVTMSPNFISANIENVGNGWFLLSCVFTDISAANFMQFVSTPNGSASFTGDGISGTYIWGAQLTLGAVKRDYFPTTTRFNVPRLDYTNDSCPSILVEPQMTNSWTNNNNTSGYASNTNAVKGATISNSFGEGFNGFQYNFIGGGITFISAGNFIRVFDTRTLPVQRLCLYVKSPSSDFFGINYTNVGEVIYRFSTLEVSDNTIGAIKKINDDTYALYIHTDTAVTGQFSQVRVAFVTSLTNDDNVDGSAILGLAYYQGAATGTVQIPNYYYTPIITSIGAVTRNADIISKTGISNLIGQTEGTIFIDYNKVLANGGFRNIISISDGTTANMIEIWDGVGSGNLGRIIYTYFTNNIIKATGVGQPTISPSGRYKICLTYIITPSLVNFKIFINGVKSDDRNFTYDAFTNPLSRVDIGNRNGIGVGVGSHNLDFILKTRITDAQAIQLTTL